MPAKSKAQQRFFGMIDAYKKGKMKHAPKKIRDAAKHISDEDARDFAKTKHEGLPEKVAHIICSRRMEKKAFLAPVVNLIKNPAVLKAAKIGYKGLEGAAALGSALYGISWLGGNIIHPGSGFRENMGLPKRTPKAPKVSPPPALGKAAAERRSMLVKQAVQAIIDGAIDPVLHTKEHLLFDSIRSPLSELSYGLSGDTLRKAFDSHQNIKMSPAAAKALNISFENLKGAVSLPRAILTPGSHQSGAALRSRIPKRLERQLYRGELRDAAAKFYRGNKKSRLVELLGSKSGKIRDMASMLLRKHAADDSSHLGRNGMIAGALAGGGLEALLQNEAFKMNGMNRSYLTNNATLRDAYNALSKGRKGTYGKAFSDAANKFKGFVNRPWVFKDEMRALGDPLVNLGEAFGNIAGKFSGSIRKDMLKLKLAKVMTRGGNIAAKAGVGAAAVGVPMALLGAMTRKKAPAPAAAPAPSN